MRAQDSGQAGGSQTGNSQGADARMDEARLDRLLALVGPVNGADLLARLDEDLAQTDATLTAALAAEDRSTIRALTHVLISVAGSVGAVGLADDARSLNAAAHGIAPLPPPLTAAISRDLTALRILIARRRATEAG